MKRFFAANMQHALRDIREELGADAVILSSKKIAGGVEVVCALNYDEAEARERISEPSLESATASSIAREAASRHAQLEDEMARIRTRLDQMREPRPEPRSEPRRESAFSESMYRQSEPAAAHQASSVAGETGQIIAEMREEIMQLRNMIQLKNSHEGTAAASVAEASKPQAPTSRPDSHSVTVKNSTMDNVNVADKALTQRMQAMGIFPELQDPLTAKLNESKGLEEQWRNLMARLAHSLRAEEEELIDQQGNVVLVGPTGAGKTTTIAKMAARFVQKYGNNKLALVTTDRFRVAGTQQLQSFGRLLNVPVIVVDERRKLDDVLDELADKRLVLIDTAGLNPQDPNWEVQRCDLKVERHELRNYLVLSAVNQPQVMKSTYHYYKMLGLSGCVITKVDEAFSLGEVISMSIVNRLPVAYFTDGQQIPRDIHHARAHALVVRAVSLWQASSEWEKQTRNQASNLQNLVV
ncbi:flagellar biosynthesis protein FlhF [Hahella ganghwensis]|uniref:flagellar biosynthesis protein FlhF n=1 Tax=Hahella ganghwensis TaxID=286420 RepID=UPI001FE22F16|nr:flagellar biosynthesis protein FlhF [Hahella ganghwensis]